DRRYRLRRPVAQGPTDTGRPTGRAPDRGGRRRRGDDPDGRDAGRRDSSRRAGGEVDRMTVARLRLAPAGATLCPPRAPFSLHAGGPPPSPPSPPPPPGAARRPRAPPPPAAAGARPLPAR